MRVCDHDIPTYFMRTAENLTIDKNILERFISIIIVYISKCTVYYVKHVIPNNILRNLFI